MKKDLK